MNRRGFLKLLGIGAAAPVLTKVVGPFQFLDERPKQIPVANPYSEIPWIVDENVPPGQIFMINSLLKEVYAPAIFDQIYSDMAGVRRLSKR